MDPSRPEGLALQVEEEASRKQMEEHLAHCSRGRQFKDHGTELWEIVIELVFSLNLSFLPIQTVKTLR